MAYAIEFQGFQIEEEKITYEWRNGEITTKMEKDDDEFIFNYKNKEDYEDKKPYKAIKTTKKNGKEIKIYYESYEEYKNDNPSEIIKQIKNVYYIYKSMKDFNNEQPKRIKKIYNNGNKVCRYKNINDLNENKPYDICIYEKLNDFVTIESSFKNLQKYKDEKPYKITRVCVLPYEDYEDKGKTKYFNDDGENFKVVKFKIKFVNGKRIKYNKIKFVNGKRVKYNKINL